ncbi:MAG: FAD/NAD(P)-binding protein [Burkholderiaceae bacterium]
MSLSDSERHSNLIIIGGGLSGTCVAIAAARANPSLSIRLLEPRAVTGIGSAYGTVDPDHRLNAPVISHSIIPADTTHLLRWCEANNLLSDDPAAATDYGLYIRRRDYARYLQDSLGQYLVDHPGPGVYHYCARAVSVTPVMAQGGEARDSVANLACGYTVTTDDGAQHRADVVVLTTGNPPARVPAMLQSVAAHPGVITDPWDAARMSGIGRGDSVLVVGASLTAADQICTLLRNGHKGSIQVISRNGLRPTLAPLPDPSRSDQSTPDLLSIVNGPPPEWLQNALDHDTKGPTVRHLMRALRTQMAHYKAQGQAWQTAFDELRNSVWQVWPRLPVAEKKRFLKRLRPWYDVYRFRIPPQTAAIIARAEQSGRVNFARAGLISVIDEGPNRLRVRLSRSKASAAPATSAGQSESLSDSLGDSLIVNSLVNCTGFDLSAEPPPGSLYAQLLDSGLVTRDISGVGFQTDIHGRSMGRNMERSMERSIAAQPIDGLRLIGPPTAGTWGDPLGGIFISVQVQRMMPGLLHYLTSRATSANPAAQANQSNINHSGA